MQGISMTPNPKLTRIRGWLLVIIGPSLAIGMAALALNLAHIIANGNKPNSTLQWTGTHDFTVHVFELFAAVFVFGVVSFVAGIFLLRRARIGASLTIAIVALTLLIFYFGSTIMHSDH